MPHTRLTEATSSPRKSHDADDNALTTDHQYFFDGVSYATYSDMVQAKRNRNQQVLEASGLLSFVASQKEQRTSKPKNSKGLSSQSKRRTSGPPESQRKSRRLAGLQSDGLYVERESAGHFTVASNTETTATTLPPGDTVTIAASAISRRINDGADISIKQAIELLDEKWIHEDSVSNAERFSRSVLGSCSIAVTDNNTTSPKSVMTPDAHDGLQSKIDALSVDNDEFVAKVVPDRIYGMAIHPNMDRIIVAAGDKKGHVGIWNASQGDDGSGYHGVHLFKYHAGAVNCLEFNNKTLFSMSYDGTVRSWDFEKECVSQMFATYDNEPENASLLGHGIDTGSRAFWTQYAMLDPRHDDSFFLSTSLGTVMHVDLRIGDQGRITFHEQWSEKKINTLSLHPNGYSMISGGLDCTVQLWDLRQVSKRAKKIRPTEELSLSKPVAYYHGGKSINSAYFSPNGQHVLCTTMNNKLDILNDFHLSKRGPVKTTKSLHHDNRTGRWLSTFMARFHPYLDVFAVGSMQQPRRVEIFTADTTRKKQLLKSISGDSLTAVASRCCFHPRTDRIILAGGNSSGRVTIIHEEH